MLCCGHSRQQQPSDPPSGPQKVPLSCTPPGPGSPDSHPAPGDSVCSRKREGEERCARKAVRTVRWAHRPQLCPPPGLHAHQIPAKYRLGFFLLATVLIREMGSLRPRKAKGLAPCG